MSTPPPPTPSDPGQAPTQPAPIPVPIEPPAVGITHPEPDQTPVATDRPHFVRIEEGKADVCGQCGQTWPCPGFQQQMTDAAARAAGPSDSSAIVSLEQAARVAGITQAEFLERAAALNTDRLP